MSDASPFGFGKFIPGFDFLQGLAQSAGSATARPLGSLPQWVAPTVSIEEVDKRISELKAVQFWLEQNGKALAATIQALEVQRMTLSTLKGMNVSMAELAQSFQFPAAAATAATRDAPADHSGWPMSSAGRAKPEKEPASAEAPAASGSQPQDTPVPEDSASSPAPEPAQADAVGQAMQWWGALTQQFQQIAAKAMAEPLPPEAVAAAQRATGMASDFAKATMDHMAAQTGAFAAQAAKAPASAASAAEPAAAARKKPAAKASPTKASPAKAPPTKASPAKAPAAKAPAQKAAGKTARKTVAPR